jgi:hypothetical protein
VSTSTTSRTIGTGAKNFITQTGKQFNNGQKVLVSSDADPTNYMFGYVYAYTTSSLTVIVEDKGGSGTYSDWNISISGVQGAEGTLEDEWALTSAPASDHTASGIITPMTLGTTGTIGRCYTIDSSTGKMIVADADAASTMPCVAICIEGGSADDVVDFVFYGFIRDDSWSFTPGDLLYCSTAGYVVTTAPSGSGDQVQVIGVATHADRVFFNPSYVLVEIA